MRQIPVDQLTLTVRIRGMLFPVSCIHAAMMETGGIVVTDAELNKRLDRAVKEHKATKDSEPEMLIVESIPATVFIPIRHLRHSGSADSGTRTGIYLYFATKKQFFV